MVAVPDLMSAYQQGAHRPGEREGRAAGDDRPLRADGRPGRHPRPAAGPERPADQGVAGRQGRLRLQVRDPVLPVDQGRRPRDRRRNAFVPPSGHIAGIWARNDDTRGVHKAPANEVVRGAIDARDADHQGRAGPAQPDRHQLHPGLPRPRHPGLGRAHPVLRPGLALPQRPPAVQLPRGVDPQRHPVGGLRAQRRRAVGADPPHDQRLPGQRVAQGRAVRADARRGVLRQVRRRDQPGRGASTPARWSARSASPR